MRDHLVWGFRSSVIPLSCLDIASSRSIKQYPDLIFLKSITMIHSSLTNTKGLWANKIAKAHNLVRLMWTGIALLTMALIHHVCVNRVPLPRWNLAKWSAIHLMSEWSWSFLIWIIFIIGLDKTWALLDLMISDLQYFLLNFSRFILARVWRK